MNKLHVSVDGKGERMLLLGLYFTIYYMHILIRVSGRSLKAKSFYTIIERVGISKIIRDTGEDASRKTLSRVSSSLCRSR